MKTRTLMSGAALAGTILLSGVILSACGSNDTGSSGSGNSMPMGGATTAATTSAAAAFNDADGTFAQQMIPHHQQAVAMAAMADSRATDPEVKKLAAQIKDAQGPEITTMTGWLTAWGKPAPQASTGGMDMGGMDMGGAAMPGMMSSADMGKLMKASGKNFDTMFLTMMVTHHEGAVTMATDEVAKGQNPDAVALAKQIITAQQAEITTMKTIHDRL